MASFGQPGSTSDRESGKSVVRVRTWFSFGHKKQETRMHSPNPAQLETEKAEKVLLESEPVPTSDRETEKSARRVQTGIIQTESSYLTTHFQL
ncbi:hypothetical protein ABE26_00785 [Cytobacillus firmus]|nr:hypothetical protein [Cytobacillus firmus]